MSDPAIKVVFCTLPDAEKARHIGTVLVERQLAACVNLIPKVESIYRWQGGVERGDEVLAIIKTSAARYPELESTLVELHPYELPEVIACDVDAGLPDYLRWVAGDA